MKPETLKIKAKFATLDEAVRNSNIDLSYNEPLARTDIKQIDRNCNGAFLMENGEVLFIFDCDIKILQKYNPFCSGLDDTPFSVAVIGENEINLIDAKLPKTSEMRKAIAKAQITVFAH